MFSFKNDINLNDEKIYLAKKFSEVCDIILFGLSIGFPIILEGENGQGKQIAILYMTEKLGLDITKKVISKSTKVEELLLTTNIDKSNIGEILVKNEEIDLLKSIKSEEEHPKNLILFQGINNASPSILDLLNSIFIPDANILFPDDSTYGRKQMNIIGIFNTGREYINKDKIPSGILFNCIYHIVDNPSNEDLSNIIKYLF